MSQQCPPVPQPPPPNVPPGYYRDSQGVMRWSSGQDWTEHVQPAVPPQQVPQFAPQPAAAQQVIYAQRVSAEGHVSGLTTVGHIVNRILTLCAFGLWAPVWFLMWSLGRRRIR